MILVTLAGFLGSSAFFSKITVPVDASIRRADGAAICGPPVLSSGAAPGCTVSWPWGPVWPLSGLSACPASVSSRTVSRPGTISAITGIEPPPRAITQDRRRAAARFPVFFTFPPCPLKPS